MPILSLDDYIASSKQVISLTKTSTRTSVASIGFAVHDLAGMPGAGVLAATDKVAGIVPTDADTNYPSINSFASGAKGYIARVSYNSSVACRLAVYDRLFIAGPFNFNDSVTLASQPSYASRLANGSYSGLQLWVEQVTASTGTPSINIGYTNETNVSGRSTGTVAMPGTMIVGRCQQLPLAGGDNGVRQINTITATVATAGTFNIMVLRPLWEGRISVAGQGDTHDLLRTGLTEVFETSAFYAMVNADSTSTGIPSIQIEVANK